MFFFKKKEKILSEVFGELTEKFSDYWISQTKVPDFEGAILFDLNGSKAAIESMLGKYEDLFRKHAKLIPEIKQKSIDKLQNDTNDATVVAPDNIAFLGYEPFERQGELFAILTFKEIKSDILGGHWIKTEVNEKGELLNLGLEG